MLLKNKTLKLSNNLNREIISNFSKAIKREPDNYLFYLERGIAKHNYGDYLGAIEDFNYSLKLNSNLKVIFHRANSKYTYGDHMGAIKDLKNLISKNIFQDQVFHHCQRQTCIHEFLVLDI